MPYNEELSDNKTQNRRKTIYIDPEDVGSNVLDDYQNYTYNFTFFVANDIQAFKRLASEGMFTQDDFVKYVPKSIIAQTGTTSLYIDDVRIKNTIGYGYDELTTFNQSFEMTITEPHGMNMFDIMMDAANYLGIENFSQHPFFLQVEFTGYDSAGRLTRLKETKIYRLVIQNIVTKKEDSGTVYEISGVSMNNWINDQQEGVLTSDIEFSLTSNSGKQHITDAMVTFENALNRACFEQTLEDRQPLTQYRFVFHPDYSNNRNSATKIDWTDKSKLILSTKPENADRTNETTQSVAQNTKTFHYNSGTRVSEIVEKLIALTDWGDYLKRSIQDRLDESDTDIEKVTIPASLKTVRIVPQVINLQYNYFVESYDRLVVLHIFPYDSVTPIIDRVVKRTGSLKQDEKTQTELESEIYEKQRDRIAGISGSGAIARHYTHTFGNANTDIENLEIHFNSLWQAMLPYYQNEYTSTQFTSTALFDTDTKDARTRQSKIISKYKEISAQIKLLDKQLLESKRNQQNVGMQDVAYINRQRSELIAQQTELIRQGNEANTQLTQAAELYADRQTVFAEDIAQLTEKNTESLVFPISIRSDRTLSESNISFGSSVEFPEQTSYVTAMYNQMYSSKSSDALWLDMQIRGDPYWMGASSVSYELTMLRVLKEQNVIDDVLLSNVVSREEVNRLIQSNALIDGSSRVMQRDEELATQYSKTGRQTNANTATGAQLFLLEFYSPDIYKTRTNSGLIDLRESSLMSGLWAAQEATHVFSGGKFTQDMRCSRDLYSTEYSIKIKSETVADDVEATVSPKPNNMDQDRLDQAKLQNNTANTASETREEQLERIRRQFPDATGGISV